MTPSHHPDDETLFWLATGSLKVGPRLVVATHVEGCSLCRERVRGFEAVGGALLNEQPRASVGEGLLAATLAKLDAGSARPSSSEAAPPRPSPAGLGPLPATLRQCDFGPWRPLQPGVKISRVRIPGEPKANVVLLKVAAGRASSPHSHDGIEYTQVLTGAFSDALGHFGAGDYIEADEHVDHIPVADADAECICLAAIEGHLRLSSVIGRWLQPLFGI